MPDEVIVGDDGSTSETKDLIESFKKDFPVPLIHLWQEDKGFRLAMMRNKSVAAATGDYIIEIDGDIFGKNLTEKIALAKTMSERIEIFKKAYEDMVLGRNSLSDKEKINEYLINRISRTKGMITMRQLEDETNYSACYLRRIFKSFHGISPKQFAQYIRFQNLLMQADKEGVRYEQVALDCGYYDEPHMMKEFKKYSGVTLEQYRKMINTNKRVKN